MTIAPGTTCPECGNLVDEADGVGPAADQQPEPGNLAICLYCAGYGYYEETPEGLLKLRILSDEEKVELSGYEEVQFVRNTIRASHHYMERANE
jgi:hypothetical protein